MGLLFKPVGIVLGILAGWLTGVLVNRLTGGDEAPDPKVREDPGLQAVGSVAVQAAVAAGTNAAVNRYGMHVWEHLFGAWPGKHRDTDAGAA
ncbi:MAG: DUF4235 domain-containing protein [Solirubrobacteraceae bacterium]|nr:DUF4235 domain-containing protein [Solirubrobacteraceae bacterium]